MDELPLTAPPVDRTAVVVALLSDEPDDAAFWHGRTPEERLRQVELLRRINYGPHATARLQSVLEIEDLNDLENLP
jgi:hypothetical protein